jgi:DedD protein
VELPASSVVATSVTLPEVKSETQTAATKEPAVKPPAEKLAPTKAETRPAKETAQNYVAQVGAYSNAERAQKVLADLKGWSFKAYSEKVDDKIRVRVGPYAEKEKAEKVIALLEKHGLHPALVTLP